MKVYINDECIGCQLCTDICPEVFKMKGDVAVTKNVDFDDYVACIKDSEDSCPTNAIDVEG